MKNLQIGASNFPLEDKGSSASQPNLLLRESKFRNVLAGKNSEEKKKYQFSLKSALHKSLPAKLRRDPKPEVERVVVERLQRKHNEKQEMKGVDEELRGQKPKVERIVERLGRKHKYLQEMKVDEEPRKQKLEVGRVVAERLERKHNHQEELKRADEELRDKKTEVNRVVVERLEQKHKDQQEMKEVDEELQDGRPLLGRNVVERLERKHNHQKELKGVDKELQDQIREVKRVVVERLEGIPEKEENDKLARDARIMDVARNRENSVDDVVRYCDVDIRNGDFNPRNGDLNLRNGDLNLRNVGRKAVGERIYSKPIKRVGRTTGK